MTMVGGLGRHPTNFISTHPSFYSILKQANYSFTKKNYLDELAEVEIGNDVWIGAGVLVLDGVKVGNGAVIAAGSVVNKNVEPYSIVGGVPAKLIRYRYDIDTIRKIQELCWWDWPIDKLGDLSYLFRMEICDLNLELLRKEKQDNNISLQ